MEDININFNPKIELFINATGTTTGININCGSNCNDDYATKEYLSGQNFLIL